MREKKDYSRDLNFVQLQDPYPKCVASRFKIWSLLVRCLTRFAFLFRIRAVFSGHKSGQTISSRGK